MVHETTDNLPGPGPGAAAPMSLPLHTRLGEFEIISVIGEGGFSIVYLAHDHQLQRTVAIKEYLPGAIAFRNADGIVMPRFEKYEHTFSTGLQSFLKEARILAQFEHHSLIRIHRFWEQNGTAYMVMQYCQGKTMRQILQNDPGKGRDELWLKQVMAPVLDALKLLHSRNCYHRDLSPDNIMILDSGAPMLLDFGAARQVIGDMTQALTVILKPGFAPIEQYADDESMRQGPWTDIYGAGAVLYFAAAGKAPTASVARLVKDPIKKLGAQPNLPFSPQFSNAVDHALALFPAERPQSVEEFAAELFGSEMSSSHFPVVPTLSGAAVAASAEAARRQAELEAMKEAADAERLQAEADEAPHSSILLQPAHEASVSPQPLTPDSLVEPVSGDGAVAPDSGAKAHVPLEQEPAPIPPEHRAERENESVAGTATVISAAQAAQSVTTERQVRPTVEAARRKAQATPSSQTAQATRAPNRAGRTKKPWGLYAGGAAAVLAALVVVAYFFGDSSPPKEDVVVSVSPEISAPSITSDGQQEAPTSSSSGGTGASGEAVPADHAPMASTPSVATPIERPASSNIDIHVPTAPTTAASVPVVSPVAGENARNPANSQAPVLAASQPVRAPQTAPLPGEAPDSRRENAGTGLGPATAASEPASRALTPVVPSKPGAYVRFAIRPWGKVLVNGVDKGTSPPMVRMWLPEGVHQIVIENTGFPSYSTNLKVEDKKDASVSYRFGG